MKIKTYFNFFEGKTAKFLKERRGISFNGINNVEIKGIKGISESKIVERGKYFFHIDGEDEYLMFQYMKNYDMKRWGRFPSYHMLSCEHSLRHSGYIYSHSMPVDVIERSTNEIKRNCKLPLCKTCKGLSLKGLFTWGSREWYDNCLDYIEEHANIATFFNSGKLKGYHKQWKQISKAYRESKKWTCEKCKIKLYDDKYYLHVHHINGNKKKNKRENFQSLCLLCHALEHKDKIDNFTEVDGFIQKYSENLNKKKIKEFEKIS
jgi:hypothetical protein|tara:strand:- start:140 stop:928 length:789 start_codon:yes stop_codon:yes gene_type:complete